MLRAASQEWIVPELDKLCLENACVISTLELTNKRLADINAQLVDQSRRIDEANKRIDRVYDDLLARLDETNKRIDLSNVRLDRLYEVVVRGEAHTSLSMRVADLARAVKDLQHRLAA